MTWGAALAIAVTAGVIAAVLTIAGSAAIMAALISREHRREKHATQPRN